MSEISAKVQFKSNTFANTILYIFCTLIDSAVEQKTKGAFITFAYFLACRVISS